MKKIYFLIIAVFGFTACSVDDRELENASLEIQEINATYQSGACTVTTFNYGSLGNIEVRNDRDYLYVTIAATGDNTLTSTALHIAGSFAEFPLAGKGNLQPQRMEHQVSFPASTKKHSFKFLLSDFGESVVIASYTMFNNSTALWAGDIAVRQGNWSYFNYAVNEHPVNAGPDNSATLTLSQANALPSWDEVRKKYAGLLAPGVDNKSGTYSPSIWDMINDFNDPARESKLGEYTLTYTLGTGDCTDSVELTLIVVPDNL